MHLSASQESQISHRFFFSASSAPLCVKSLSLFHSFTLSLFHSFTLSLFHSFTLSLFHSFTLSLFHSFTLSLFHSFTLSLFHSFTLSLFHSFTLSLFHFSHPLCRNKITSPSCTTYSFPSNLTCAFSRAAPRLPAASKSFHRTTSARMKPFSMSL